MNHFSTVMYATSLLALILYGVTVTNGRHFSLNDTLVYVGSSDCVIDTQSDSCDSEGVLGPRGVSCTKNSHCFMTGVCVNNVCDCASSTIYYHNKCVPAPQFKQRCVNRRCAQPYICSQADTCSCPSTMTETYYGCNLECASDEVLVVDKCMKKIALNNNCSTSIQCSAAFSACVESKCICIQGTASDTTQTMCLPTYRCDNGLEPLKSQAGVVLKCRARYCPNLSDEPSLLQPDTCPDSSHCVFPSHQNAEGFCCPEQPWCPNGSPSFLKRCINPLNQEQVCPLDTHHCYSGHYGTYCCPLPCPSVLGVPAIIVQGICYGTKQMGESCTISEQCPENTDCSMETHLCSCPEGYLAQYRPEGTKCRKLCTRQEIVIGTDCFPRVLPQEHCTHSVQCTEGTVCRDGACQCPCHMMLYGGKCIQIPKCPRAIGSMTQMNPLVESSADGESYIECSPGSLSQVLIRTCPSNGFCASSPTLSGGGVCCPLPAPVCENGRLPPQDTSGSAVMCDLVAAASPVTCPDNQHCRDYATPLLPIGSLPFNTIIRGVCCYGVPNNNNNNIRGRPVQTLFPNPLQPMIIRNNTSSTAKSGSTGSLCPIGHDISVDVAGQARFCNFDLYHQECGKTIYCFRINPSLHLQYSGVCCKAQ